MLIIYPYISHLSYPNPNNQPRNWSVGCPTPRPRNRWNPVSRAGTPSWSFHLLAAAACRWRNRRPPRQPVTIAGGGRRRSRCARRDSGLGAMEGETSPDFRKRSKFWGCWKTQTVVLFLIVLETQPVAMFAGFPTQISPGALGDGGGTSGRAEGDGRRGMVPWDQLFSSGFLWDLWLINFRRKPC